MGSARPLTCALEQAVRRITAIRQTALGELDAGDLAERLPRFTDRARTVVKLAIDRARADAAPAVGTGHLLAGMLAEGQNLALHVLRAVDIDPAQVQRDLDRQPAGEEGGAGGNSAVHFSDAAAGALELTVTEATAMGHNYVGCEHLLLGLITEPDGTAGQVLRALGAESRLVRRAVTAALAGYVHLRAQTSAAGDPAQALAVAVQQQLQPLIERIERLEQNLGSASEPR
ncbi:Clp protease N-terminal domain-containing protein [Nonomuraea sp. NPDC049758]|uniref:Clp protease N-terminal domain-containing protein n=1 Tax=Nonomuraea sp. NPDC049758 TaxID=3154360 RepID=UPI00341A8481